MINLVAERIRERQARIAVVGQGYVGLPLAVAFAQAGFRVTGLDADAERVVALGYGRSHSPDVRDADLTALVRAGRYRATADPAVLPTSDIIIVCVPTPLRNSKDPDISFVIRAAEQVAAALRTGHLVVLESTTYPGTTEEMIQPMFEARGARCGRDVFLAFSPERIDPGNARFAVHDIPKVVGGVTASCTRAAALLYRQIVPSVIEVSSPRVAELAKLYENVFRNVNIALANELALICRRGGQQAVRVHAVLSGTGDRRPLHRHRSDVSRLEAARGRVRGAVHPPGRRHQPLDARLHRGADQRRPQRAQTVSQRRPHPRARHILQARSRRHSRIARPRGAGAAARPRRPGRV